MVGSAPQLCEQWGGTDAQAEIKFILGDGGLCASALHAAFTDESLGMGQVHMSHHTGVFAWTCARVQAGATRRDAGA
eukprot:350724-Chlamydomonas_euryale.AAC.1